jgi:hypothetical protein
VLLGVCWFICLFACLFVYWLVCLVGSVVCCIQPFGEEVYGKEQAVKDTQKRVGKEWIRV